MGERERERERDNAVCLKGGEGGEGQIVGEIPKLYERDNGALKRLRRPIALVVCCGNIVRRLNDEHKNYIT